MSKSSKKCPIVLLSVPGWSCRGIVAELKTFSWSDCKGLRFFYESNDHYPAHFHVQKDGAWNIRVYFLKCTEDTLNFDFKWPKKGQSVDAKTQKMIREKIVGKQGDLLKEFEKVVNDGTKYKEDRVTKAKKKLGRKKKKK